MKFVINATAFLVAVPSVNAFFVQWNRQRINVPPMHGTSRPDSSNAVADALRISKEFGSDSKEARVAWDIVEEMDSNDSSPAFTRRQMNDEETKNIDYFDKVHALSYLLDDAKEKLAQVKELASQIKRLELTDPNLTKLGSDSDQIKTALAEAKAAIEVHGPNSSEAAAAWRDLEACVEGQECSVDSHPPYRYSAAALKAHHFYDAVVDSSLLQESIDAIGTVENLARFMKVEKSRLESFSDKDIAP